MSRDARRLTVYATFRHKKTADLEADRFSADAIRSPRQNESRAAN